MPSKLGAAQRGFLRRLEGADAGADSATARRMLLEDGQDVTRRTKAANAARNVALGNIWGVTPTTTTCKAPTASAAGKAALQRAAARRKKT